MRSRRKKNLGVAFVMVIVFVSIAFCGVLLYERKYIEEVNELIMLIYGAQRDEAMEQELLDSEEMMVNQLNNPTNRVELRASYFGLGYIESFKGNPIKSNEYFFKALRLGEVKHHWLNVMIYRGISNNYLILSELEKSQEYFQKAEAMARGYEDNDMLAMIYRSRAYGLVKHRNMYDEAVNLLQRAIYVSPNPVNQIEGCLQLANIYMNTFLEESAINYSLRALELSIKNESTYYQKLSHIALGTAYYLNHQYEKSIDLLKNVIQSFLDDRLTDYMGMLVYSYLEVEGIEAAITELESYRELLLEVSFNGNQDKAQRWMNTLKSSLYLKDKQYELALAYWNEGHYPYEESDMDMLYRVWRNSLYASIQFGLNPNEVKALNESNEYYHLYEFLASYTDYPALKIGILMMMINQSVDFGNYEAAYNYSQEILKNFTSEGPEGITIESLYEWLNDEIDCSTFEQRHLRFLGWFFGINSMLIFGYSLIYYIRKNKQLERQLKLKRLTEPVTDVLTIPSFYSCLELWDSVKKEIYFLAIDIDCFEKYNQTYGILAGELVLQELSKCIKKNYPYGLVARLNGCQFIVTDCGNKNQVILKAKQLIEEVYALNLHHVTNLKDERITISIGISKGSVITSKLDVDKQIETAQKCLKEAKQKGRNTLVI